ncbi:DUF3617 domain-containing protein [Sandarakinorhabdus sp.]|uniref:DUF3617 domain-containing protein n=1 Tax=Sandarakinorhabdus sp. TaxID=1916663 RepID=UPI00286E2C2C|nr:DUF3617 domain-containing protein [Sandarakinorhabdus sp.]
MRRAAILMLGLASAASAESPVTPGKWQTVTKVESMTMPGVPPDMAKRMAGKPMSATYCITPAQAAAGPRDVIGKTNGACRYRSFAAAAGRITAVMECKAGSAGTQTIAISGSYSPTAYDIRSKMSGGAMQSSSRTMGKRLGPC